MKNVPSPSAMATACRHVAASAGAQCGKDLLLIALEAQLPRHDRHGHGKLDFAGQNRQFPPLPGPARPSRCSDHPCLAFPL
jgi:hypothetical protein